MPATAFSALLALVCMLWPIPAAAFSLVNVDFDALTLGPLAGGADQDYWYAPNQEPGLVVEIQGGTANPGRALHMLGPAIWPHLQAEAKRNLTPPDLALYPIVTLSFDFYCSSADLSVTTYYEGLVQAVGGPHPGYTIVAAKLWSGNGGVRSEMGLNLELVRFAPEWNNNEGFVPSVGANLTWNQWHTVTVVLDQAADRYVSVTVDGDFQDLSSYHPQRTYYEGQWLRGQLIESLSCWTLSVDWGGPNVDEHFHVDNIDLRVESAEPGFLPPPSWLTAEAGDGEVALSWQAVDDPEGIFHHYAIYRDTASFSSVAGMVAIDSVMARTTTSWTDSGASNGTSYWYAVTTVTTEGNERTDPTAVGPVAPSDSRDLQVMCISRTPRYPRYLPTYSNWTITEPSGFGPYRYSVATGLDGGQTGSTQRWPNVGDPVTYTAVVRNRSGATWSGALTAEWRVDGALVASPSRALTLAAGDTALVALVRNWDDGLHDISFRLTVDDARAGNNELFVGTKSVPFLSYIDQGYGTRFMLDTPSHPGAVTDDIVDWLNHNMRRFNEMFSEAGTSKRVHYDLLQYLGDWAADPTIDRTPFAIFPFRFDQNDGIYRNISGYYDAAEDVDYGLLHEMGHQLGLIDLYRLDVPAVANQVSGTGYLGPQGLMHGCSHFISEHSAHAMDHWLHEAHGYYGQYLYCLPEQVKLRFVGMDGQPLAGASVRVYQKCERPNLGEIITTQIKAEGTTDAAGEWVLPNVPINPGSAPPSAAGDTLLDNPFGYVAVVGTNGTLLLEVEQGGFEDHAWLDITEVNNAYWNGQTQTATIERELRLGGKLQTSPPFDLAEPRSGAWGGWGADGTVTLSYDTARKVAGAGSLRMEATGGFEACASYPGEALADWDLSSVQELRLWAYAENDVGFQNHSPWFRLRGADGYVELHATGDVLNGAIGHWREFVVPLAGDAEWTRSENGTPSLASINALEVWADTWDYGFTLWLDGVTFWPHPVTGVDDPGQAAPAAALALGPAIPNPFNPRAEIEFSLPREGRASLCVHDARGRLVRRLIDEALPAGTRTVSWDGLDERGRSVPSGAYFYRLSSEDGERVGRMTLVR